MKNLTWLIGCIALIISACTSQKQATTYVNDDVYNTSPQVKEATVVKTAPGTGAQVVTSPDKAKAQPPSATFADDYNDYSYSDRIKRFNNKDTTQGYFDSYYTETNGGGGIDNNPDVNLYLGAGYGDYYGSSFGFSMGWGYPSYGWGYPYYGWGYYPWYDPWYYPYYPYYGYGYGYGCCCGYWDSYYPPYYTYESYYGPRNGESHDGTSSLNARSTTAEVSGQPNARTMQTGSAGVYTRSATEPAGQAGTAGVRNTEPASRTIQTSSEKYRYTRPADPGKTAYTRSTGKEVLLSNNQGATGRQQPPPKYVRPETVNPVKRSGSAQNYTSQAYRQPRSSQEYLAPRSQGTTSGQGREARSTGINTRQGTSPASNNRTYASPSGSSSKSIYNSGRSGSTTTTPSPATNTRTYSAPTRSSSRESYSAPSNSGKSGGYSAPARSGGGGGAPSGGGSGSGSGGGHRR